MRYRLLLSCVIIYMVVFTSSITGYSQTPVDEVPWNQFSGRIGLSYYSFNPRLPRDLVIQETHPADTSFLFGDAGSTELQKINLTTLDLSVELSREAHFSTHFRYVFNYTLKIPVSKTGRDERQHLNDPRPPTSGSFEYTQINHANLAHELGIGMEFWRSTSGALRLAIGGTISVGYWSMEFEKGWTRFGADETALKARGRGISIFPHTGISLGGEQTRTALTIGYRYINFDYDSVHLNGDVASGWALGALLNFALKEW